jgi:peptidylprolyl isomerase
MVADYPAWSGGPPGEIGFVGSTPVRIDLPPGAPPKGFALHCAGAASFAHGDHPDSANSQIFFVRVGAHGLDGKYSIFGRVVSGQEAVLAMADGEPPANPDRMTRVRLLADIPAAQRPQVMVVDPRSPAFTAEAAKMLQAKGAGFNICDVPVTATVR